jgi:hypothetical protein
MNSDFKSQYLKPEFHYYGMNKGKLGKGYRDGVPLGRLGGKCDECDGTVIAIQMNTSRKGMECSSEKVCDTCGLVHQGAFTVLQRYFSDYSGKSYGTHDAWVEDMKKSEIGHFDDIDPTLEYWCNWNGKRPNNGDVVHYGDGDAKRPPKTHYVNKKYKQRLRDAEERLDKTNQSKNVPRDITRMNNYVRTLNDYSAEIGMMKHQREEAEYIVRNNNGLFNIPYKVDDIIYAICLEVYTSKMSKQMKGGIMRKFGSSKGRMKQLQALIRTKISLP